MTVPFITVGFDLRMALGADLNPGPDTVFTAEKSLTVYATSVLPVRLFYFVSHMEK